MSVVFLIFLQNCPKGFTVLVFMLQNLLDRNQVEERDFRGILPFRDC